MPITILVFDNGRLRGSSRGRAAGVACSLQKDPSLPQGILACNAYKISYTDVPGSARATSE
eukprot:scaffold174351_cov29-Tisochrysis_lutea.AAC.3